MRYLVPSISIALLSAVSAFAEAKPAAATGPGGMDPTMLLMMVVMFVIIYFLMIRPQQKKQKETQNMLKNIQKGDKILTIGGMHGVVSSVKDDSIMVKVSETTIVEFQKSAVATVIGDKKEEKKDDVKKIEKKDEKK